jgi:uncharacterized protein HemX
MGYRIATSSIVVLAALAAISGAAFAQDRDVQHQPDQSQRDQRDSANQQQNPHREDSRNSNEHQSENGPRMASGADQDMTARYRSEHPHSAARCHDGFFTRTTDRNRACSKHGGIDTWLLQ